MKQQIENYLGKDGYWKRFFSVRPDALGKTEALSITVTRLHHEGDKAFFAASLTYRVDGGGEEHITESGIALFNEQGEVVCIHEHLP